MHLLFVTLYPIVDVLRISFIWNIDFIVFANNARKRGVREISVLQRISRILSLLSNLEMWPCEHIFSFALLGAAASVAAWLARCFAVASGKTQPHPLGPSVVFGVGHCIGIWGWDGRKVHPRDGSRMTSLAAP
jgi:hypothetical protein